LVFWAHDAYKGRHWLERCSRRTPPDHILVNSRFSQSVLGNLFPEVQSTVIHYPVSPSPPIDGEGNRSRIRRALQTSDDAVVIVQTSRLERWKGHTLLLDALQRLAAVPGWVCWIAGGVQRRSEETYLKELRRRVTALGVSERVRFLGQRADVPNVLAAADIHCQPNTEAEPFGVAFVEALHAGLPVVTTAMGGALEIVDDRCGLLVPPGSAEALADALRQLIGNPELRARLGWQGPVRARELCDPIRQVCKVVAALADVDRCGVPVCRPPKPRHRL
jgi:glycosyltransferase involved in cell wall biosynthesis